MKSAHVLLLESTVGHEYVHYGDDQDGVDYAEGHGEEGQAWEEDKRVYGQDLDTVLDAVVYQKEERQSRREIRNQRRVDRKTRKDGL